MNRSMSTLRLAQSDVATKQRDTPGQRVEVDDGREVHEAGPEDCRLEIADLPPARAFAVRVRAINAAGASAWARNQSDEGVSQRIRSRSAL